MIQKDVFFQNLNAKIICAFLKDASLFYIFPVC